MKFEPMKVVTGAAAIMAVGLMAACASQTNLSATPGAQEKIFETNVTNDLTISSGEPEIAIDPKNPHHIAIVEFALGSAKIPAYSRNVLGDLNMDPPTKREATGNSGRVMLSTDGGNTWSPRPPPVFGPGPLAGRGGDPMIAYGPDGTLYVGDEPFPEDPATWSNFSLYGQVYAASTDGGKTFSPPKSSDGPMDRPWLIVDQSNGAVYTASSGQYNAKTNEHNVPGPDAPMDRWLVAWQPHLAGKSEPRRIGGPDFSASGGSTLTATHGVVAATFVLGGAQPGLGFTGARPGPTPVPVSLQSIVQGGVTSCSMQAPCLFFETSSDQGLHWSRHHVIVPGGFNSQRANLSADPTTPGRYAIAVMNAARTNFLVLTTKDSGATWSGPVAVSETAPGVDFKQWMAFGPSGVIGLMWRKERADLAPAAAAPAVPGAPPGMRTTGPAFDVYAAISCDSGTTWYPAMRVNAETSPAGPAGYDDLSYIALDAHYAHLVWGDRRMLPHVTNTPGAIGGIQTFYERVPFSVLSQGAKCGHG